MVIHNTTAYLFGRPVFPKLFFHILSQKYVFLKTVRLFGFLTSFLIIPLGKVRLVIMR